MWRLIAADRPQPGMKRSGRGVAELADDAQPVPASLDGLRFGLELGGKLAHPLTCLQY